MIMLQQMIVLFILMMLGAGLKIKGKMGEMTQKQLSALIVDVANPCLIINSSLQDGARIGATQIKEVLIAILIVYGLLIVVAQILPILFCVEKSEYGIYRLQTVFTNMGFMGLPLAQAVYGDKAVLYLTFFVLAFNTLFYSYGYIAFFGKDLVKEGSSLGATILAMLKNICNVGVISCIIAMVLYFGNIGLPYILAKPINMMAQLPGPIAMILIGASLAEVDWKKTIRDVRLILFTLLNLLVIPVGIFAVLLCFVKNEMLLYAGMITLATPVASMSAMLAKQTGRSEVFAAKAIAATTFLSVITLPVVSIICEKMITL